MADMNLTPARASLTPKIWDDEYFTEYVRKNLFFRYMGKSMSDMIQVREDLERKAGDRVVFATARRLVGAGVTGNQLLEGNEELLNLRSMELTVNVIRHAVAVSDWDEQKSIIPLREVARDALQVWDLEKMRDDILLSLTSVTANASVQIPYASATAGQRDTWLANNSDRVLVGAAVSNSSSNVMATSLLTIDNTADKLTTGMISLAKRRARMANPRIRPIQIKDGTEWYVLFVNSYQMRDLRADPVMINALSYAAERGKDNPLFAGGDLIWDAVIIREIPELMSIAGAGAGGIAVGQALLCGAQAMGIAWAQRSKSTVNNRDYNFTHGVGIQEMRGIGKLRFGRDATVEDTAPVDQGMVTIFTASVGDA